MAIVNITGLDQVEVFRRLYNRAKTQGMGFMQFTPQDMTPEQAKQEFSPEVDYHRGRVMKITFRSREAMIHQLSKLNLSDEEIKSRLPEDENVMHYFDPWLYNRDNGDFAAEQVISKMRAEL